MHGLAAQSRDGRCELNPDAAGVAAVALAPCSTQEAASSLIRRLPLTLRDMRVAVLRKTSEDGAESRKGRGGGARRGHKAWRGGKGQGMQEA